MALPRSFAELYNWLVSVLPNALKAAGISTGGGGGGVTGAGTSGRLVQWTGSTSLGDYSPAGMSVDANTIALWKFSAASPGADETGNYPLTDSGTVAAGGLIGNARWCPSGTYLRSSAIGSKAADWIGELTCEALAVLPSASVGALGALLSVTITGETSDTNALGGLYTNNGLLKTFWETGSGTNISPLFPFATPPTGVFFHYAIRRRLESGGTTMAVDLFVNGRFRTSVGGLTPPTGGTSTVVSVGASADADPSFQGIVNQIRVSKVARTDAELLASARACGVVQ